MRHLANFETQQVHRKFLRGQDAQNKINLVICFISIINTQLYASIPTAFRVPS